MGFHRSVRLLLLLVFSEEIQSYNVTSYLNKYQIRPEIEGNKAPFRCHNGGRLVRGRADYSIFPQSESGQPLSFLQESTRQGFHCECPDGFTGLRCGRPYERCGISSANRSAGSTTQPHICFNHGRCLEGLNTIGSVAICDCNNATFRGKTYTGKYCEKTAPDLKTCNRQGSQFCVHGQCEEAASSIENLAVHMVCACEDGYAGEHCNFLESEEPSCDLDCGPGTCRITYAHHDGDANDTLSYWQNNVNHTYCSCPPGHTGTTCEISAESLASGSGSVDFCDDSKQVFCVNGGVCKSDLQPEEPCSCPVGLDGPHCEFTEGEVPDCILGCQNGGICTIGIQNIQDAADYTKFWEQSVNNMYCKCPEGRHGVHCEVDLSNMNSRQCGEPPNDLFCFNGVCDVDKVSNQPICHCRRGYTGHSCQYKSEEVPDCKLDCQHGSCELGIKTLVDNNDINRFWENHVNFTHCRCDVGWYGTNCEIPSTTCGSKTCLGNGTKCATDKKGQGYCDCASVKESKDPLALAGEQCQFEATSLCVTPTESYYCYNDGICSSNSAGCDCRDGFSGPVCEYEEHKEPKCSLKCQNGGLCKKGNKYISNVTQNPELSFLQTFSSENFGTEHCLCQEGYAGNMCETKVEVCGDDKHVCLHGSKCIEEEDGSHRCDCEKAFTPESRYAGKYCQHHHTDMCANTEELIFDGSAADVHFCVNDGVCRQRGSKGYPGCDCGSLYFGSRCEFSRLYDSMEVPHGEVQGSNFWVGPAIYMFFLAIVFAAFALVGIRIRQKRREMAEIVEESKRWVEESLAPFASPLPAYRDDIVDGDTEASSPPPCKSPAQSATLDSVEIL